MDNTSHIQLQPSGRSKIDRFFCVAEYLHKEYDEDSIHAEILKKSWPLIIVADGVSVQEDASTGQSLMGEGRSTSEHAVKAAREYLNEKLPFLQSVEEVLVCLRTTYDYVVKSVQETKLRGASTLLLSLLWHSERDNLLFWCYGYEGDGYINLLSPSRAVEGIVIPEKLVTPQKVEATAAVQSKGLPCRPAIGCRLYEAGDLVYVASDGIAPLDSWLRKEWKRTLPFFLLSWLQESATQPEHIRELKEVLSACPHFVDDAVLGVISIER